MVSPYNDPNGLPLRRSLSDLSFLLVRERGLAVILSDIAVYAASAIPGADGVGVTVLEAQRPPVIAASTDFVRAVDKIQYGIGEGPCIDAVRVRRTQVCGSLRGDSRWPHFGPRAGRLGVHSALSLPLLVFDQPVGALNV